MAKDKVTLFCHLCIATGLTGEVRPHADKQKHKKTGGFYEKVIEEDYIQSAYKEHARTCARWH